MSCSHPEGGSVNMDASMTLFPMGHFSGYLASVEKVPDRIIKGVVSTLKAFNGDAIIQPVSRRAASFGYGH